MTKISTSTSNHLIRLFNKHSPELVLDIIQEGLFLGYTPSRIRESLNTKLNDDVPPRVLPLLFEEWFPGTLEMTTTERKQWAAKEWPVRRMAEVKWGFLYDSNHPVFKHFTKINQANYQGQKSAAKKRGVAFEFDFITWIVWWIQTGHFHERGVMNHQYQMCRKGDTGPYNWDNVYCDTGENNKKAFNLLPNSKGKQVTVNGINYKSITDAVKKSKISRYAARKLVK